MKSVPMLITTVFTAAVYVLHRDIPWHYYMVQGSYHFRGWYAQWHWKLASFTTEQVLILGTVFAVFLWSAVTLNRNN